MENIELTEEIVVVGYGVSKKRDIVEQSPKLMAMMRAMPRK